MRLLYGERRSRDTAAGSSSQLLSAVRFATRPQFASVVRPVARCPLLGRFLKWRHARFDLANSAARPGGDRDSDGLLGPQVGAMNLAGVLPWIHWRGLSCWVCWWPATCSAWPVRSCCRGTLARRCCRRRAWPRWLRSKWLAVALLGLFLLGLRSVLALGQPLVDGLDRDRLFCRWPSWSTVSFAGRRSANMFARSGNSISCSRSISPLEVKVREPAICASCRDERVHSRRGWTFPAAN